MLASSAWPSRPDAPGTPFPFADCLLRPRLLTLTHNGSIHSDALLGAPRSFLSLRFSAITAWLGVMMRGHGLKEYVVPALNTLGMKTHGLWNAHNVIRGFAKNGRWMGVRVVGTLFARNVSAVTTAYLVLSLLNSPISNADSVHYLKTGAMVGTGARCAMAANVLTLTKIAPLCSPQHIVADMTCAEYVRPGTM